MFCRSCRCSCISLSELGLGVMVFNATSNNISVISRRSFLLVEETGENHRPAASHWQTLSHNVVSITPHLSWIPTHSLSGDMHWLCSYLEIQLPHDQDHDGPFHDRRNFILLQCIIIIKFQLYCSSFNLLSTQ